jgi:hypothetical protein
MDEIAFHEIVAQSKENRRRWTTPEEPRDDWKAFYHDFERCYPETPPECSRPKRLHRH